MLKELEGYDWEQAFLYASGDPVVGAECAQGSFNREDVAELIGIVEGENDGDNWVCAGRLNDGRWFCLSAGCDYTGWDCQAGGAASVADDRESLIRFGMSEEERSRLGVKL